MMALIPKIIQQLLHTAILLHFAEMYMENLGTTLQVQFMDCDTHFSHIN